MVPGNGAVTTAPPAEQRQREGVEAPEHEETLGVFQAGQRYVAHLAANSFMRLNICMYWPLLVSSCTAVAMWSCCWRWYSAVHTWGAEREYG